MLGSRATSGDVTTGAGSRTSSILTVRSTLFSAGGTNYLDDFLMGEGEANGAGAMPGNFAVLPQNPSRNSVRPCR